MNAYALVLMLSIYGGPGAAQDKPPTTSPSVADDTKKDEEKESPEKKRISLLHELEIAKIKLDIANLEAEIGQRTAQNATAKAERDVRDAEESLAHFRSATVANELEKARIARDKARHASEHAKDELAELIAMYSQDDFAEMTKELVLKRGRRQVEIAERELAVQTSEVESLESKELPRREKELSSKLEDARAQLEKSRLEKKKSELDAKVVLLEARFRIEKTSKELADLPTPPDAN